MSEREYIVSLNRGVDYDAFWDQIENVSADDGFVPTRRVNIENERPGSLRSCHYLLTDDEAKTLREDARVYSVEIPPEQRDDIEIGFTSQEIANFNKTTIDTGNYRDWGKIRHSFSVQPYIGDTTSSNFPYIFDGTGVDVVIQDSGLQVDHPEFAIGNPDAEYNNGAISNVTGDGSDFFKREVTTNGVRIMGAGTVGGQTAVPDAWLEKVARMFELFTDTNGAGINETFQRALIKTLSGDAGTYHAGVPTIQRVARGAGSDYSTNFLTDAGIIFWNLTNLFDTHVQNDMVWYLNSTGDGYGDGDIDAQEVIEHVFHTLHMHGLPADDIKLYSFLAADWQSGDLYAAMEEAYDAGKWDPSGYQNPADDWKTNADAFEVAAKEYLYLLNFCMFEYTSLWEGGSLAPEWTDDMRTQAGIQSNNPLGYAFHNTYIAPIISKPSLATIRSIFQDGNTPAQDNPAIAGASGYVPDTGYRVHQIDWAVASGLNFTQSANHYRDWDGHGTHVAGTAGGKNFGWAKNARIYSVKLAGLEGPGDSGTGISTTYAFDCIKLWHRNKPVDPVTGYKRPTIVNMSWGYSAGYGDRPDGVSDLVYRGTTYNLSNDTNFNDTAHRTSTYGFYPYFTGLSGGYRFPVRIGSVDVDVQELIDEGIHVCIAAGNNSFKIDVPGGADYNNIVFSSGGTGYYHRGNSPYDDQAFMVGCLSATTASPEQKVSFSSNGPGVDIYAAGHNIISASSNINRIGGVTYFDNPSFKQMNISGTSMASPQVCGLGAIYLQANPDWSPAQLRDRLHKDSVSTLEDGGLTDYADTSQISGGPNRLMVSRYGVVSPFNSNLYALGKKR